MNIDNFDLMKTRLRNSDQQDRIIADKRKTLDKAILYSYQGAKVKKLGEETIAPALINPNAVKQDYDDKVISIGNEYNYKPGTIFEWINTNTYWLIYLQDLTELAYFRGDVRKCSYEIKWVDKNGNEKHTYAAMRGPKETGISSTTFGDFNYDTPNYTLYFMVPKNEDTLTFFTRYSTFYLQGNKTCWRVEAIDDISIPGILEVNASEYYANETEDNIEQGIVDGNLAEPQVPASLIEGPSNIRPKKEYEFAAPDNAVGNWTWDTQLPISATVDGNKIKLKWIKTYNGEFTLSFGSLQKTVIVESLF